MPSDDYKGFRYGVKTVTYAPHSSPPPPVGPRSTTSRSTTPPPRTAQPTTPLPRVPLIDLVAEQLASEAEGPSLGSLELIELGAVYVNDVRCLNSIRMIDAGDVIRIHTQPRRFATPPDLSSRVVAETQDAILVEKPIGLPCDPTVDNVKENLLSFLEDSRGQRFYLVHRLAIDSEGLLLVAKSPAAQDRLARAFKEGRLLRRFVAYVESPVRLGEHHLASGTIEVVSCQEQRAETSLISENRTVWLVIGKPLTVCYRLELEFARPRPKDVRAYLASIECAVIGDRPHGSRHELLKADTRKHAAAFVASLFSLAPQSETSFSDSTSR